MGEVDMGGHAKRIAAPVRSRSLPTRVSYMRRYSGAKLHLDEDTNQIYDMGLSGFTSDVNLPYIDLKSYGKHASELTHPTEHSWNRACFNCC
jgi:hypothetical protein